MVKIKPLSIIL